MDYSWSVMTFLRIVIPLQLFDLSMVFAGKPLPCFSGSCSRPAVNIVPARPVRKLTGFPYSRLVTDKSENMTGAILDTHRQIRRLVYTPSSGSNLRFNHRGDFVWHYRRILLNLNVNTRFSRMNCTKRSCTFPPTTCKLSS